MTDDRKFILEQATSVVASYVGNNTLTPDAVPDMILSVYKAIEQILDIDSEASAEKPVPAVPLDESISDNYIVCLEDGKKYKSLKRHLRTSHGMTPKAYTDKWKLPADYPMVAPNYSVQRSRLAKRTGLGRS